MQHLLVRTSRKRLLKSTDWQVNSLGRDYSHRYGYGLIDAGALVELAGVWNSVPPQRNYTHVFLGPVLRKQVKQSHTVRDIQRSHIALKY